MNLEAVLMLMELLVGMAKNIAVGTPAEGVITNAQALEQIAATVLRAYQIETGQALDLSKLTFEEPIQ